MDVVVQLIFSVTHLLALYADCESAFASWTTAVDTAMAGDRVHTFELVVTFDHRLLSDTRHDRLVLITPGAVLKEL